MNVARSTSHFGGGPRSSRGRPLLSFFVVLGTTLRLTCLAAALILVSVATQTAKAAELVMYERAGCPFCHDWHREIGPTYPKTTQGLVAPLLRRQLSDPPLQNVHLDAPITVTPTFVLVESGREIGRIIGYPGPEFFFPILDELLERLRTPANAGNTPRPSG